MPTRREHGTRLSQRSIVDKPRELPGRRHLDTIDPSDILAAGFVRNALQVSGHLHEIVASMARGVVCPVGDFGRYGPDQCSRANHADPRRARSSPQSFVFDGHNDLPWELRSRADAGFVKFDIAQPQPTLHTDIARLKQGGVGAQFWSAYVPADTMKTGDALLQTLEQIDLIHRLTRRYPRRSSLREP